MSLQILDKPLSLHARAITIGLRAHSSESGFPKHAAASCDHLKLIAYRLKHPNHNVSLVWVIMDSFYMLSESYKSIIRLPDLQCIDHIFVVGDCGSLDMLRLSTQRTDLKLLLGSHGLMPLIRKLQKAGACMRLKHEIPPALLYETWDLVKDLGSKPLRITKHAPLFFAGNDGLIGIVNVFKATDSVCQLDRQPVLHPNYYQEVLLNHLRKQASLAELAVEGIDYFNKLSAIVERTLYRQIVQEQNTLKCARIYCLKAILFKAIFRKVILSWLEHNQLGVVIIKPKKNKSFYAHKSLSNAIMLDLGGLNGFEQVYPRTLDCFLYNKKVLSLNDDLRSCFKAIQAGNINSIMYLIANIESRLSQPHF